MYDYIKTSHEFIPILELKLNHVWINAITNTAFFRMLVAPTVKDKTGMGKVMGYVQSITRQRYILNISRIAKDIVTERFAMKEKLGSAPDRNDMLDSFIEKGLTQEEAEAESLLQMSSSIAHLLEIITNIATAWPAQIQPPPPSAAQCST